MTNPTQALDAVEQALQVIAASSATGSEFDEFYHGYQEACIDLGAKAETALPHLATLRQQVAALAAFREAHEWQPIENLTRGIKGEVLFIERIGGDSCIEDTFAGSYCSTKEHGEDWFDCFVNPSANVIPFRDVVKHYTHFCVAPTSAPAAEGGQGA